MANEAAGEYLPDEQVCVVVDQGNPPVFEYGETFIGAMRTRSVTSCTTNGTCPGVDTMTEAVFCFPAGMASLSLDKQLVSNLTAW
jgi:hypothetical protein